MARLARPALVQNKPIGDGRTVDDSGPGGEHLLSARSLNLVNVAACEVILCIPLSYSNAAQVH